jgi:hypothetical protein
VRDASLIDSRTYIRQQWLKPRTKTRVGANIVCAHSAELEASTRPSAVAVMDRVGDIGDTTLVAG